MKNIAALDKKQVLTVISKNPEETLRIGEAIGRTLENGDIVALFGDLGAGKTTITQGIAKGIGIPDEYYITSPTFTLINEYPGKTVLFHLDVYRLSGSRELEDLGYEEYFDSDGILVIEWAEKIEDILPLRSLFIRLEHRDEQSRNIIISGHSETISKIVKELE